MKGEAEHIPHVATGAYPLRPGNEVEALVDGEKAFRSIAGAVAAARRSVWTTRVEVWDQRFSPIWSA